MSLVVSLDGDLVPIPASTVPTNTTSGSTYKLVLSDQWANREMISGSANTVTIPVSTDIALPLNVPFYVTQGGTGITTIAGAVGTTVNFFGGVGTLAGQYTQAQAIQISKDVWIVQGALGPVPVAATTLTTLYPSVNYLTPQLTIAYDATHKALIWMDNNTYLHFDSPLGAFRWDIEGVTVIQYANAVFSVGGSGGAQFVCSPSGTLIANYPRFAIDSNSFNGLGDGGAAQTVSIVVNSVDVLFATATAIKSMLPILPPVVNSVVTATSSSSYAALTTAAVQKVAGVTGQAAYGVKLPTGVAGLRIRLIQTTTFPLVLAPDTGGTINGLTANATVTIPSNASTGGADCECTAASTWTVVPLGIAPTS